MFQAARELLFKRGVRFTLEDLSIEELIAEAGVSRSSVYRRWPFKDDFVNDLLPNLAGPDWMGTAAFDRKSLAKASTAIIEGWDRLNTPEGRRAVMVESVRQTIAHNFKAIVDSREWYVYAALAVTARQDADPTRQGGTSDVSAALLKAETGFIDFMADFYAQLSSVLGLRLRPGVDYRQLAAAGSAVVQGLAIQHIIALANMSESPTNEAAESLSKLTSGDMRHPAIEEEGWTLASIAYLAVVDAFTEPDPDWAAPDESIRDFLIQAARELESN